MHRHKPNSHFNPSIIAITEAWLSASHHDENFLQYYVPNYKINRYERTSKGGDVAIFVSDLISSIHISNVIFDDIKSVRYHVAVPFNATQHMLDVFMGYKSVK